MKYELYIDVFFLLNFFLDTLLLLLIRRVLKCTATHLRLLMGGAFGAGMTCILTVLPGIPVWLKLFAGYGMISICMIRISFRQMDRIQVLRTSVYLYGFAFLFGGILHFLTTWFPLFREYGIGVLGVCTTGAFLYGSFSLWHEKRNRKQENGLLPVILLWKGNIQQLTALVDTGNRLYEPIGGKPVSILEKSAAEALFGEGGPEMLRAIPFHSIGKAHGILEGCELTEMIVTGEHEKIRIEKPMVGLFDGKLSADGAYQMILHPTLTKKQEESV